MSIYYYICDASLSEIILYYMFNPSILLRDF